MSKPKKSSARFEFEQPAEKARPIIVPCKLYDTLANDVSGVMRGYGEELVLQLHSTGNGHSPRVYGSVLIPFSGNDPSPRDWDRTVRIPSSTLAHAWHTFELGELWRSRESVGRSLHRDRNKHLEEYNALTEACERLNVNGNNPSDPITFIDVIVLQIDGVNPLQDVLRPTSRNHIILYIPPLNQSDAEALLAVLRVTFDAICCDNTIRRMTPHALKTGPGMIWSPDGIAWVAAAVLIGAIGTSIGAVFGGLIAGVLASVLAVTAHLWAARNAGRDSR
jgi:hypothetical protein